MTFPIGTNIQPEDTVWYGNTVFANAPYKGYMGYADAANDLIEIYNITNTANIEYAIAKPDVGQNLYFLNSAVTLSYTSFSHILYLKPPNTFFQVTTTSNTDNVIELAERYCCIQTTVIRDNFGNPIDTTPPDKKCHGFVANDNIWQERDDGRRITAVVDREDCANGALYVSLATGHFQQNRNIYKDNGSITANIFAAFANLSGKILYTEGGPGFDLLVEREQFEPREPTVAIDKYFTGTGSDEFVIHVDSTVTPNTVGRINPEKPIGNGFGNRKGF